MIQTLFHSRLNNEDLTGIHHRGHLETLNALFLVSFLMFLNYLLCYSDKDYAMLDSVSCVVFHSCISVILEPLITFLSQFFFFHASPS